MQPTGSSADALTVPFLASMLFSGVALTTALAAGLWVSRDAQARGSSIPYLWGFVAVLGPGIVLYGPAVLLGVGLGERRSPPDATDRALGTWLVAGVTAILVGTLRSPPDPFTMAYRGLAAFAVALVLAYLLVFRRGYRRVLGEGAG